MTDDYVEFKPGHYRAYGFRLTERRPCRISGRITGVAGGSHDVDVFLVIGGDLRNFQNGHALDPVYSSRRRSSASLDLQLSGSEPYHLVVSNRFSVFTSKLVRFEDVIVVCGRTAGAH